MLESKDFMSEESQSKFDFRGFIFKTLSYWKWFLAAWAITFFVAYNVNLRKERVYKMENLIAIEEKSNPLFTSNTSLIFNWGGTSDQVKNISMTLKSRTHNERVVDQLGFYVEYLKQGKYYMHDVYGQTPYQIHLDKSKYQIVDKIIKIKFLDANTYQLEYEFDDPTTVNLMRYDDKSLTSFDVNTQSFSQTYKFGQKVEHPFLNFTLNLVQDPGAYIGETYILRFLKFDEVVLDYQQIEADSDVKAPSLIKLALIGKNKKRLVDYLNSTVDILIKRQLERKNQFATNTIAFIDSNLVAMEKVLKDNEKDIIDYTKNKNLHEIEAGGSTLTTQLTSLDIEKENVVRKIAYYDNLKSYLSRSKDYSKIPAPSVAGIEDAMLVANISQFVSIAKNRDEYSGMFKTNQLFDQEFDIELNSLKKAILENVSSARLNLEYDLNRVNKRINEAEASLRKLPSDQQEYARVTRSFNMNDAIFTTFLQKRNEAQIVKASNLSDIHFIDTAKDIGKGQIGPNLVVNYVLAFFIGFLVPIIIIFTLFFLENSILNTEEISKLTSTPIIGIIGVNNSISDLAVFQKPRSALSESFRAIRSSLQFIFKKRKLEGAKTIMLTSSVSGEGKTFCSINIATVFALSEKKTIIIGFDLRKPRLFSELTQLKRDCGVTNYLLGEYTLDEVIQPTGVPHLDVILSGTIQANPSELLIGDELKLMMEELKARYEYVILDTPPVGLVSDAVELAPYADVTLYIVRQNFTKKDMISLLNQKTERGELNNMSIVFNGYENKARYGTGYGYGGYGYGYGPYSNGYHLDDDKPLWKKMINKILPNKSSVK